MTGSGERRNDAETDDKINDFVSHADAVIQESKMTHYAMIMLIDFIAINLKVSIDKLEPDLRGPAAAVSAHLAPMLCRFLTSDHPEEMWTLLVNIDQRLRRSYAQYEDDRLFS